MEVVLLEQIQVLEIWKLQEYMIHKINNGVYILKQITLKHKMQQL